MSDAAETPAKPKPRKAPLLQVPTNPDYVHDVDPEENEFQFWNPVAATNKLIMLSNADLSTTEAVSDAIGERNTHKEALEEAERKLERLERALVAQRPLGNTESKNNKTTAAAIYARAIDAGRQHEYDALQDTIAARRAAVTRLTGRIDRWMVWIDASERVGRHLQTALSFVKSDYGNHLRGKAG